MLGNVGAERAVVAGILKFGRQGLVEIEDVGITDQSFTQTGNQAIFLSTKHILENKDLQKIDQTLLLIALKDLGYIALFETKKDIEYIASLFNFPIELPTLRDLAIRLEKLHITRMAIQKHREAIEGLEDINGTENIEHIIQLSENPIFELIVNLNKSKDSGPHLLFEKVEEVVQNLRDHPCDNMGIPTPWANYNAAIGGGLRRGGVNLVAARPKAGKSTLAKECLLHCTEILKIPSLMLDTEMVLEDQLIRSLASISEVRLKDVESGSFKDHYFSNSNIDKAVQKLKTNRLFWYESIAGKPFEEILAIIRRWIVKEVGYDDCGQVKNCVVVYDYFKLMDRNQLDNLQEYQAMGFQISKLTDFCKEFDFPCLAFVQLNRQNDISQSDRLRWLAYSYSSFAKKEPQEQIDDGPNGGNRKLKVVDTRYGPGIEDNDYICMNFNRDINKIVEVGLKSKLNIQNTNTPLPMKTQEEMLEDDKENDETLPC